MGFKMKIIYKVLLWVLIVAVVMFFVSAVLVAMFGKKIIEAQLTEQLKAKTTFKSVSLGMPFSINVSDLKVENLFSAERISFYPDLPALLGKKVSLYNLNVRNGEYVYTDQRPETKGFQVMFKNIDLSLAHFSLPLQSLNSQFRFNADIATNAGEKLGEVSSSGWLDMGPKNLDADFEIKDLEITYFSPYYGNFISERKILSAKVNLVSKLKSDNNDLKINSHFRLFGLIYAQSEDPEDAVLPQVPDLTRNTLDLFTDKQGNLDLNFILATKLDKPQISVKQLKSAIMDAAMRNLSNQPLGETINKVQKTIEQFKDFGEQMQKIFKGKD